MWDLFQTSIFNAENLPFIAFGTLATNAGPCLCTHASDLCTHMWALNQPWALEFQRHWGTGARVVWGTKCGVYRGYQLWSIVFRSFGVS